MSERNRSFQTLVGPIIALAVVVSGIGAYALATSGEATKPAASDANACEFGVVPAETSMSDAKDLPPPPTSGKLAVVDVLGNERGTMDIAKLYPRPQQIPSNEMPGTFDVPVTDKNGKVSGYWIPGYGGFVDTRSAHDPELLAQLIDDPSLVVDSAGHLISGEELEQRRAAGTACVR